MFVQDSTKDRVFLAKEEFFATRNIIQFENGVIPLLLPPGSMNFQGVVPDINIGLCKRAPRPPNSFILYRKHNHSTVVAQNPGLHNNAICKFSII